MSPRLCSLPSLMLERQLAGALACPEMTPPTESIEVPAADAPQLGVLIVMEVLLGDVVIWVNWRQGLGDREGIQEGGKYWEWGWGEDCA